MKALSAKTIATIAAFFMVLFVAFSAAWYPTDYIYQQQYNVSCEVAGVQQNFPVRVVVDTADLISAGKMNSNCSDVRFTNASDNSYLNFYTLNNTCNTTNTVFYVQSNLSCVANNTQYLYYGYVAANNASNAVNTFSGFMGAFTFDQIGAVGDFVIDAANKMNLTPLDTVKRCPDSTGSEACYNYSGVYGKSLTRNGTGQIIRSSVPWNSGWNASASMWINVNQTVGGEIIRFVTTSYEGFIFGYNSTGLVFDVYSGNLAKNHHQATFYAPRVGEWTHVGFSYHGTDAGYPVDGWTNRSYIELYVNGTLVLNETDTWFIGDLGGTLNSFKFLPSLTGSVDDVRLFNYSTNAPYFAAEYNKTPIYFGSESSPGVFNNYSTTYNSTAAGTTVKFTTFWNSSLALNNSLFEFDNGSGIFVNDSSWIGIISNTSNITKLINYTVGSTIRYRFYLNATNLFLVTTTTTFNTTGLGIIVLDEDTSNQLTFNITVSNSSYALSASDQTYFVASAATLPLGSSTVYVSATNYISRSYFINIDSTTNFNNTYYLLKTSNSLRVSFITRTQNGQTLTGVLISIYRSIGGITTLIAQQYTDSAGTATFYLNPTIRYSVTAVAVGYATFSGDILPGTSDSIQIIFSSTTNAYGNSSFDGINYTISPYAPNGIPENQVTKFSYINFSITDAENYLSSWGLNITDTYSNGTVSFSYSNTQNSVGGGNITVLYNSESIKNVTVTIWWKKADARGIIVTNYTYVIRTSSSGGAGEVGTALDYLGKEMKRSPNTYSFWSAAFLPLLFATLAGAFISRFSPVFGGAAALIIIAFFTFSSSPIFPAYIFILMCLGYGAFFILYRS